jgi:hypothetical protein
MRGPPPSRSPGRRKLSRRPKQLFHPPQRCTGTAQAVPFLIGLLSRNPRREPVFFQWLRSVASLLLDRMRLFSPCLRM